MDADLDLLLIAVFCTADDLLPTRAENARRIVTDAELVTLAVAQQLLGINSDEQFCAGAPRLASVPPAAQAPGLRQAPPAPGRHDRGADRRVRRS
jgi:hypothetical protein